MNMILKIARLRFVVGALALGMLAGAGCGADDQQTQQQAPGSHAADAAPMTDTNHAEHPTGGAQQAEHPHAAGQTTLAGVTFTVPSSWQDLGASGMRQAQYRTDPVAGDDKQGEVNVFYFGPASGGGVDANLSRWIGQMTMPDGSDPAAAAERGTFTTDGMAGHIVSLDGTYKSGGGRPMGGTTTLLPGYRLVGVVIEGPQGSLFFKLTGPEKTARAMEADLLKMVKSAHK